MTLLSREPVFDGATGSLRRSLEDGQSGWDGMLDAVKSGMHFGIVGEIENVGTIAVGGRIYDMMRLCR